MKYLVTLVLGMDPFVEAVSVGVFRWKWWAWLRGWFAKTFGIGLPGRSAGVRAGFGRLATAIIWDIPTKWSKRFVSQTDPYVKTQHQMQQCIKCESQWVWDGLFAPKWEWSKRPCFDCVCEAKAQGFDTPKKTVANASISFAGSEMVIDPEAMALVPRDRVKQVVPINPADVSDCPECANGMAHSECRSGWKETLRDNIKGMITEGLLPKWKPPCGTCGGNCGQCGSSHCSICGQKNQFPHLKVCDPAMHAAHEATKCEKCGGYADHFCSDGKRVGEEYSSKNVYKKGEKDAQGDTVNW